MRKADGSQAPTSEEDTGYSPAPGDGTVLGNRWAVNDIHPKTSQGTFLLRTKAVFEKRVKIA